MHVESYLRRRRSVPDVAVVFLFGWCVCFPSAWRSDLTLTQAVFRGFIINTIIQFPQCDHHKTILQGVYISSSSTLLLPSVDLSLIKPQNFILYSSGVPKV